MKRENILDRFMRHVSPDPDSGCWLWTGSLNAGYGQFSIRINGKPTSRVAHRFYYEAINGAVPKELQLDHLCRVRRCVNPAHLEPVTPRENTLRSDAVTAENAFKTHCLNGHPLSGDNLRVHKGWRLCKRCHRDEVRRYRARLITGAGEATPPINAGAP